MRYAVARYNQYQRDMAYRFYIAENLRIIGENTARIVKDGKGKYIPRSLEESFKPQETRTGDEIVADVLNKLGLEV